MAVDRDKVLQAAQKLVEKKRYDKAIVEYQRLVVDDPKDVRTLLKIGDLYLKMEQHADAIGTYERVGQFYSTQGFHLKAIAVYKQIREIIHKHVPHLEDRFGHIVPKLAETYAQLGLTSDALAAYDEVATRYQRAGRDRDAIDVFRKVVDLDPQNPLPHLRLAEAFMRVKDIDSALQRFGAAAEILLKLGRRDDALKVVERLLQHRADAKFARTAAEIYLERGEATDAMAALSKLQICFKENPKDLETLALLARSFDKLGQPTKSIEVQKEAARIAKDAGKLDHFNALVEALIARAPQDEGVRQLVAMRQATPSIRAPEPQVAPAAVAAPAPRAVQASSVDLEVDEDVVVDEDDVASSGVPFALHQQSRPPAPPDEAAAEGAHDVNGRVRQILQQVDAYRHAKDYDHAIAHLFETVEELPSARELREKLCDVLIEAGDQAEAVRQMLAFARWLSTENDVEAATRILDEVLLLEPLQPDAIGMLRELGYTVQGDDAGPEYAASDGGPPADYPSDAGQGPSYDPSAPLPSYDLEEISAVDAMGGARGAPHRAFAASQLDDPFGEAPLPSFDLDDDEATRYAARDSTEIAVAQSPPTHPTPKPAARSAHDGPKPVVNVPAPSPSGTNAGQLDEQALEEVEFFASNNMFDEARALLEGELGRLPNHPLLLERLRELDEHAAAQGAGSGTRAVPRSSTPSVAPPVSYNAEDRSFDIAASLDALDALDAGPQEAPAPSDPDQVSVEAVFEQFKAGVAAQISETDAATHYDLGAAYKEMGLLSDAISEFELAGRDPGRECVCQWMIGMIHREQGQLDAAISAFIRGLHVPVKTPEQEMALTYEIGDCYEERRATDQALYYFQRVSRMNPAYTDLRGSVGDRVRRLEPAPLPKPAAKAVGAETVDEFDAVLDDLLGGGKLPLMAEWLTARRRDLALVTLAALSVRLWWNLAVHPLLDFAFSDMGGYLERAHTSIESPNEPHGYFALFPWGTHFLLSLVERAFGYRNGAALGVTYAVLGALAVAYGFALCRRFTRSPWTARVVGAVLAGYYPWIALGGYALSEPPFTLFLMATAFHALAYADRGRPRDAFLAGAMLAAGAVFRPQILAALPLYALHVLLRRRAWRRLRLRTLVPALAAPLALVTVISAVRVHFHTGRYGFIAGNGPLNYAFGRCHATSISAVAPDRRSGYAPPSLGALQAYGAGHPGSLYTLDPARETSITVSGHIWEAEPFETLASECVLRTGAWRQIKHAVVHVGLLWFHNPMWPDSGQPRFRPVMERSLDAHNLLVLPAAAVAMALAFRRRHARAMLLALHVFALVAVAMIYFGDTRLRAPYDGILVILAASTYAAVPGEIRRRLRARTATGRAAIVNGSTPRR